MHLKKLQISSMKRPCAVQPTCWLVALQLTTVLTLLVSAISCQDGSGAGAGANTSQSDEILLIRQKKHEGPPYQQERKCVPVLNYGLSQQARPSPTNSDRPAQTDQQTTKSGGVPDSFVFPIGDIDMPLSQTGGSVQAAMRFLASFDGSDADDYDSAGPDGSEQAARQNSIKFVHNKLHISGLNLTMLKVNLYQEGEPKFGLGLNIANTTLVGQFYYNGLTPTLMGGDLYSKLAGHYRMSIDNVLITASSNLTKRRTQPDITLGASVGQQTSFNYKLTTNDFKMNISDLGYISIDILDAKDSTRPTSNYMLKMLQRVLQKTIKRTYNKFEAYISQTLEIEGRRFLECELTRFSPILSENAALVAANSSLLDLTPAESGAGGKHSSSNLDDLARIISSEISGSRLARVELPNFEYNRSVLGTNALIVFTNGSLSGLDNVNLNGETKIKLQDEHLIVNASVGWSNLRPQYNWTLYLGAVPVSTSPLALQHRQDVSSASQAFNSTQNAASSANSSSSSSNATGQQRAAVIKPMAKGFVAFNIKAIDFDAFISKGLGSQTRLTVDQLTIKRLDGPKMDLGGLPGVNRLTRAVVNFFMGRLKQRLVTSVQPALKQELERVLNQLAPFNGS